MLSLGQLYTDDTNNDNDNDDDDNDDDNNNKNNDSTNNDDNDTWWTNHDCIGSLACMPNEPKMENKCNMPQLPQGLVYLGKSILLREGRTTMTSWLVSWDSD